LSWSSLERTRTNSMQGGWSRPCLIHRAVLSPSQPPSPQPEGHSAMYTSIYSFACIASDRVERWCYVLSPRDEGKGGIGSAGASSFDLCLHHRMNRLFSKKPKKSLKPSQRHASLGIPTNVAAGPLGFRAELDIGTKGKRDRLSRSGGGST